jgi:taurine--2-oxoglutarate transaminase
MTEETLTRDEIIALCKKHTMYSWAANRTVDPKDIARAEGIWMWTHDGRRILDWNSQLMSVNIGHGHPRVREAMKKQIDELLYVWPGTATTQRALLGRRLAEIVPGDINTFFFCLSGAEANENAMKAARLYTGRNKIMSRYRSYHGATRECMQLTGDPRRWPNEPGSSGFIKVMDPWPYTFGWGATEEEITANNLRYLQEVIEMEGPHTIAAMFIETVTGTNGILAPPRGYLKGLKQLLESYGILLVCDEVMAGFGRTGKLLAFEHGDIVPDIVTMAKGLTSSYAPLGAMGVSDAIAAHFQDNVFWGGLTYNSHNLGLATALANLEVLFDEGLVENAAAMGTVMGQEMDRLVAKHPSCKAGRCIGLFGMMDVQKNAAGEPMAPFNGKSQAMNELSQYFWDAGLFTFVRWGSFMCNPPLCITEDELRAGFAIVDAGLDITDRYFEG